MALALAGPSPFAMLSTSDPKRVTKSPLAFSTSSSAIVRMGLNCYYVNCLLLIYSLERKWEEKETEEKKLL